ncbi:hypothetical protein GALL_491200 [mine drainage metagenome]|uniref:Uncharacterized protein n=1 Tax=mine drainage metagenome TaxID=410659 RepID=A0A1J5PDI5_9ZZZZ
MEQKSALAGLVRMERQRKFLKSRAHCIAKPNRVGLVLETGHHIISVAHDDHVAGGLVPSPALGPQVEDVVRVDVGEEWRCHRALSRPPVGYRHRPVFEDARPQPFPDQADNALVADPVLDEADQPVLADRVEKRPNVGVKNVIHLPLGNPHRQGVQRIVCPASGPKPVREPEKVFLVDGVQHHDGSTLDDLVLQSDDRQRPLLAVRLRNIRPAGRKRPVRSTVDASVQIIKAGLDVCLVVRPRHASRNVSTVT